MHGVSKVSTETVLKRKAYNTNYNKAKKLAKEQETQSQEVLPQYEIGFSDEDSEHLEEEVKIYAKSSSLVPQNLHKICYHL